MSALRIAQPHEPVRLIDLGPAARPYPLKGTATLRGHLCVPESSTAYRADRDAGVRVRRFRARHGLNGKGRVAK